MPVWDAKPAGKNDIHNYRFQIERNLIQILAKFPNDASHGCVTIALDGADLVSRIDTTQGSHRYHAAVSGGTNRSLYR